MTFNTLYYRMGQYCLYYLRDELLNWKNANGFTLKNEIPDNLPEHFLAETLAAMKNKQKQIKGILAI